MNWGNKIALVLGVFMLGMIATGIYMVSQNNDSLEDYDYYERAIGYNAMYSKRENIELHQAKPQLRIVNDTLYIQFAHAVNQGTITLKRSADADKDVALPFSIALHHLELPVNTLIKGAWKVQMDWQSDELPFYYEQQIYLN